MCLHDVSSATMPKALVAWLVLERALAFSLNSARFEFKRPMRLALQVARLSFQVELQAVPHDFDQVGHRKLLRVNASPFRA